MTGVQTCALPIYKHRLLITGVSSMDKWGVDIFQGRTEWFAEERFIPLEPGYEIVNLPTSTYKGQEHQDFKLGIDIAFGKPEIAEGNLVLVSLNKAAKFIGGFVNVFEKFLLD